MESKKDAILIGEIKNPTGGHSRQGPRLSRRSYSSCNTNRRDLKGKTEHLGWLVCNYLTFDFRGGGDSLYVAYHSS